MNVKVSVIVPVYNGEKFIEKCVSSLLCQTISQLQVILINDGSGDASGTICDRLAVEDDRIYVIHKENGGASSARNMGIQEAKGEYIGFVDADDWIEQDMFEKLYVEAREHDADIVVCDTITEYENGRTELDTITRLSRDVVLEKKDFYPELLREMAGSAWRCIYRTQQIHRHALKFNTALKFSEDRVFNIYAMGYANKVIYLKKAFYHHLMESQSAVHRFHMDYYHAICEADTATEEAICAVWANNYNYIRAYKQQYINGAISTINNYFYRTSTMSLHERLQIVRSICKDKKLCAAIKDTGFGGIRGQWIAKGKILYLVLSAYATNIKNRR
ncbi:MAG: glycosyltransferase [Lachnospiraceae bacterium]|nr:glycosyltransferase [Lachnospiraceae bacterium]